MMRPAIAEIISTFTYNRGMFDSLKGMAGMAGLLRDLPKIKARMQQVKDDLARITVDAETGGGAVRATANGQMRIVAIHIDQPLITGLIDPKNPDDRTMAEDLIIGAVNAAIEKAKQRAEQELANAAQELNLPIPPGGLGNMLG
jgi:DNA-binding YbaB/EbfC family protein